MGKGINSTEDLLSHPSFRKWAKGTGSKPDAIKWDTWVKRSESNRKLAAKAQAELLGLAPTLLEQSNSADEWDLLYGQIKRSHLVKMNDRQKTPPSMWGYRVAVIFLVSAITTFFAMQWQQNKLQTEQAEIIWHEVTTAYSQQKKINLTDGSTIILSANSSIVYSDGWVQNSEVEIYLQGEAYFDITPRKSSGSPSFKVKTSDGTVLVTGTRFVVDADESRTRVVLEEGSVDIERNLPGTDSKKELISLQTDQLAEFNNELLSIKNVNPEVYTSWTRQELVLDGTPFSFLTDKISKTYGVIVKVNDADLYDRKLTGTINFRSIDRLLGAVSEVLQIEATQNGDKVIFRSDL